MADTREKLIELIQSAVDGCATYWAGLIADHLIANGVTVQEWISVKDRLPESKEKVLVYGGRTEIWFNGTKRPMPSIHTGYLRGFGEGWFGWDHHDYICDVTHWMPLPELPQPPKGE